MNLKEGLGNNLLEEIIHSRFSESTYEDWLEAANKALKGKSLNNYYKETYEDITIKPLYTEADLPPGLDRAFYHQDG